jgi:hypothetical protein
VDSIRGRFGKEAISFGANTGSDIGMHDSKE